MKTFTELLPLFPNNQTILDTVAKTLDHIEDGNKIMVSVSGGADSDILVDLFETIGYEPGQVVYVWFDTGLEYEATKRHLVYLEEKYGITIERHKAKVPIPLAVKKYGVPFISKRIAMYIGRLQRHGFSFDKSLCYAQKCESSCKWWNNQWGKGSSFNISVSAGLKEFMENNPPPAISDVCCQHAKKNVAHEVEKKIKPDISVVGVRQAEGGIRAKRHTTCFTPSGKYAAQSRPLFFWSDADRAEYEAFRGVVHSDCYTVYGMKRTGCAGCPFNSRWEEELEVIKQYEPKLYKAACSIFGESYEYTRKYRKFKESWKREKHRGGQIDLFDNWEDLI